VELGASSLQYLIPLVLGGVLAAPFGGWAVKRVSPRALMTAVGMLIVTLSVYQLLRVSSDLAREDVDHRRHVEIDHLLVERIPPLVGERRRALK